MTVAVRSFAKINLGLYIGAARADGFHDLRTVYQTIALHDVIRVSVGRGSGIEIMCKNNAPRVPLDSSNTCYRMAELVLDELGAKGRVSVEIEKRLPVQGGLGAASSNAVATMVALGRALRKKLYPLADLPSLPMVVVMPEVGVSTPQAFADWDALMGSGAELRSAGQPGADVPTRIWTGGDARRSIGNDELTRPGASDRLFEVGCALSAWLSGSPNTGAPAKGGSRAGNLLLDLVRTGIENDFERVVFPQYPELRDTKGALERAGSRYASLSGSGSTLYGLFQSRADAARAVSRLRKQGLKAVATSTLTRRQYWKKSLVASR